MLIGDFIARTANNQTLNLERGYKENSDPIWLEEEGAQLGERSSQDDKGKVNHFGAELLGVCCLHNMVICNGVRKWPNSGYITCKTYNGQSVVDYAICSQNYTSKILEFEIGECPTGLNLNHNLISLKLTTHTKDQKNGQQVYKKRKGPLASRILMTQENQEIFRIILVGYLTINKRTQVLPNSIMWTKITSFQLSIRLSRNAKDLNLKKGTKNTFSANHGLMMNAREKKAI